MYGKAKQILDDMSEEDDELSEPQIELNYWEQALWDLIQEKPHPRHIYWIYDAIGGKGKSTFFDYIEYHKPNETFRFSGGKQNDILCGYRKQSIVLIDLTKS